MSPIVIAFLVVLGIAILGYSLFRVWLRWKYHISSLPKWYYKEAFRTVHPYLGKFTNVQFNTYSLKGYVAGYLTYVSGVVVCNGINVPYTVRWAGKKLTYVRVAQVRCYFDEDYENAYLDRKEKRHANR